MLLLFFSFAFHLSFSFGYFFMLNISSKNFATFFPLFFMMMATYIDIDTHIHISKQTESIIIVFFQRELKQNKTKKDPKSIAFTCLC